ncbi:MAG TPA: hypothetical protein VK894_03305 [Jiangellales bacterium]|nr:hypothetical protein [Jiangellales bacterium]
MQVDGHLVVGDPLVPSRQRPACRLLEHSLLTVRPGERPDGVQVGEESSAVSAGAQPGQTRAIIAAPFVVTERSRA